MASNICLKSELDTILCAQIIVAWAGEAGASGDERRLGWWRTYLVAEFGGEDLCREIMPHSWQWAVLQGVREAARRADAVARQRDHAPDTLMTIFSLGFDDNERIDERLQDLKRTGQSPYAVLTGLNDALGAGWDRDSFLDWVQGFGAPAEYTASPLGRQLKGAPSDNVELLMRRLVSALAPLSDTYPLPHVRRNA